jgi:uncharacterized protein
MRSLDIDNRYTYLCNYNIILNNEIKDTFLKYSKGREVRVRKVDLEKDAIEKNVQNIPMLTMEISQKCSLRCSYCPYNGGFLFERSRSDIDMSLEIALKGIDYIYSIINNRYKKEFTISFYGGEPLLNFELIKQVVSYSKTKFINWDLKYSITTNGTIMNKEIIDFLISNNFSVLISLDGPPQNHNAKRVYPDGSGSFKTVWANILKINETDPTYFKRKISFSVVQSKDLSIIDTFDFFLKNKLINENSIRFNFVNERKNNYYERYTYDPITLKNDLIAISKRIKKTLKRDKRLKTSIEKELCDTDIKRLFAKEYSLLMGACKFSSRLYLDANGKFHICEKMNNRFSIGDVWNGFSYTRMQKILEKYLAITRNYCAKCEIKILCSPCYVNFAEDGNFKIDKEFCKSNKKLILNKLKEHVLINEIISNNIKKSSSSSLTKIKKFHQFVMIDRGPVNVAIINLLKGNVFQVENKIFDKFNNGNYEDIKEFIDAASKEELIIEIDKQTWIPTVINDKDYINLLEKMDRSMDIQLEVEEGVNLDAVIEKFSGLKVFRVNYFEAKKNDLIIPGVQINYLEKNFEKCIVQSRIEGCFKKISEAQYMQNRLYNSCWGKKIAVTSDGNIRPCIYSNILLGNLGDNISDILEKAKKYWYITKDKVDKCKDCELKYVCFDCREIASRAKNELYAMNPYCMYDPYKGTWKQV